MFDPAAAMHARFAMFANLIGVGESFALYSSLIME